MGSHMKVIIPLFVLVLSGIQAQAQSRLPIIDMHMHARTVGHYGSPPLPICAPVERMPRWDQRKPIWQDDSPPPCSKPLLSRTCAVSALCDAPVNSGVMRLLSLCKKLPI